VEHQAGELGLKLIANMEKMTADRIGSAAINNARFNRQFLDCGRSLKSLRDETIGSGDSAIVIAAGPSIKRKDPLALIKARGFKGAIVATESAMLYCLRQGVVPDLVVTLDPHESRIVRWFGDPDLSPERLAADDYYRRQDMDPAFANEVRANVEIMNLLDHHGKNIRIALATSASETVVRRVLATGMKIYWWNPMLDDPDLSNSRTLELHALNGLPCVNAGGNVGSACWMMAQAVLAKKRIGLTGMDFSYYEGTSYRNTQYYREAIELVGEENLDSIFIRIYNPYLNAWFFTDPAYMWYREILLEMAADADCATVNCTEGGILFGNSIRFAPLAEFLDETTD
jgi:hypothetical protein